jgi:hypothetical protein
LSKDYVFAFFLFDLWIQVTLSCYITCVYFLFVV